MEFHGAEARRLKTFIEDWWTHPTYELEASFGARGTVTMSEFLRVTQRLKSKGYEFMPQQDKLNIITPEHIRYTLDEFGAIQQYCRDNDIKNKAFEAIIKDRVSMSDPLKLEAYSVGVKVRREEAMSANEGQIQEMLAHWAIQKKAFRLIRRWSFIGKGFRIDLSMVRQTARTSTGQYKWVTDFQENSVLKADPIYEIEVELLRDGLDNQEEAQRVFIRQIGEVLRGIQNHTLLLSVAKRNRALEGYKTLTKLDQFRGAHPVTLEIINMSSEVDAGVPNIRTGYNVTDKADGLRCHGYCDSTGELYLIDMGMQVYRTGLVCKSCANSLVDGEWITRDTLNNPIQQFAIFDIYYAAGGKDISTLPFYVSDAAGGTADTRWKIMQKWLETWRDGSTVSEAGSAATPAPQMKTSLSVFGKDFAFANAGDTSIFAAASKVLGAPKPYHTDGLIFTPNGAPLPGAGKAFRSQFKWKPALENTIDFLVLFEKDQMMIKEDKIVTGLRPDSGETVQYKTMRLYVGSDRDPALADPRAAILYEQPIHGIKEKTVGVKKLPYRPVLFTPVEHPDLMASYSYGLVENDLQSAEEYVLTEKTNEPIMDRSIVEFRYDPKAEPGWRWVPVRIRHDKTERFLKRIMQKTMNNEMVAEGVWNSIHDPVTETMIRTGAEQPSEKEMEEFYAKIQEEKGIEKMYYDRKASTLELSYVKSLREFHNWHIKEQILYRVALYGGGKKVLDVACGKAGDLNKIRRGRASFLLGVDLAGENIMDPADGAYRRYVNSIKKFGRDKMPTAVFVIGDSSKPLVTGDAAVNAQDRDILRSVFGRVDTEGALPSYIENKAAGVLRGGTDVVVCMFALHYFFEREAALDGLIKNINDSLKVGGHFIGACFDGDKVYEMLRGIGKGDTKVGAEGNNVLWTITKQYDNDDYMGDAGTGAGAGQYGCAIDIDFITIGTTQREYLVPFGLFQKKMAEVGCELLSGDDLRKVGLKAGSELFSQTHVAVAKKFPMSEPVKQYSYLNRWFVFVRKSDGVGAVPAAVMQPVAPALEGTAPGPVAPALSMLIGEPKTLGDTEESQMMAAVARAEAQAEQVVQLQQQAQAEQAQAEQAGPPQIGTEGAFGTPIPTIPVEPLIKKRYAANEVFNFFPDAAASADAKLGSPLPSSITYAARWLAPYARFPIKDGAVEYPTMEHYMAAMRYKLASNRPELAASIFARDGEIHLNFLASRKREAGERELSLEADQRFLKEEAEEVRRRSSPAEMKRRSAGFNEMKWATVKDGVIEEAIRQRMTNDAKFKAIVDIAKANTKYLLYYTGSFGGTELGGVRRADGSIEGDNRIGKTIMRLAGYTA